MMTTPLTADLTDITSDQTTAAARRTGTIQIVVGDDYLAAIGTGFEFSDDRRSAGARTKPKGFESK